MFLVIWIRVFLGVYIYIYGSFLGKLLYKDTEGYRGIYRDVEGIVLGLRV